MPMFAANYFYFFGFKKKRPHKERFPKQDRNGGTQNVWVNGTVCSALVPGSTIATSTERFVPDHIPDRINMIVVSPHSSSFSYRGKI